MFALRLFASSLINARNLFDMGEFSVGAVFERR